MCSCGLHPRGVSPGEGVHTQNARAPERDLREYAVVVPLMAGLGPSARSAVPDAALSCKAMASAPGATGCSRRGAVSVWQPGPAARRRVSAENLNSLTGAVALPQRPGDQAQTGPWCYGTSVPDTMVGTPPPGLSHWNFVVTEWNPRHGVNGAGCPPPPFSFLAFASQLLRLLARSWDRGHLLHFALCALCPLSAYPTSQSCPFCLSASADLPPSSLGTSDCPS